MNFGLIARLLSGFVLFFSLALVVPLIAAWNDPTDAHAPFLGSIGVCLGLAVVLWILGWKSKRNFYRKEGLAVVGLAWFLAGGLAAMPFVWSGHLTSFVDAFFESISGLTTTGASILGPATTTIESLPTSLLLWRSMLQWLGGMGIVLVFIVLLPGMGVTGSRLLFSEQVGVSDDAVRPRMADQARRLFFLYVGLTAAAALSYWIAGLSVFDAVCHSFTTLASGGFSTNDVSVGGFQNLGVEMVALVFMFLAGCNFLLVLRMLIRGGRRRPASAAHLAEFRTYFALTVGITLTVTFILWFRAEPLVDDSLGITHDYRDFGRCLRDGAFQTVSLLTSTGYVNADFQEWPKAAVALIFVCMVVGGCTGSTAGGLKVLRLVLCAKLASHVLRHFVRPRMVEKVRIGKDVVPDGVLTDMTGLLLIWVALVGLGTWVLDFDPRLDLAAAFTTSVSMMCCMGPSFGESQTTGLSIGPYAGFGELQDGAKLVMSVQMVLGRLEVLAPLAILTPGFWRR